MIRSDFREWTLEKIEAIFGQRQVRHLAVLDDLIRFLRRLRRHIDQLLDA